MDIPISKPIVLNNLIRFRENLADQREDSRLFQVKKVFNEKDRRNSQDQQEEKEESKKRRYRVMLNRRTGDMRFAEKISHIEQRIVSRKRNAVFPNDWKEIILIVHETKTGVHFEATDAENLPIQPSELEPVAWRIASETMEVLNLKGEGHRTISQEMLPEESVLADLSSIHVSPEKIQMEDLPGWQGSISRLEAEKRLKNQSAGTYLLREGDEMTLSITFHLEEENHLPIHSYVLTSASTNGKVIETLLLHTTKGWIVYSDNPDLKDSEYCYFPNPHLLIRSLGELAVIPLDQGNRKAPSL